MKPQIASLCNVGILVIFPNHSAPWLWHYTVFIAIQWDLCSVILFIHLAAIYTGKPNFLGDHVTYELSDNHENDFLNGRKWAPKCLPRHILAWLQFVLCTVGQSVALVAADQCRQHQTGRDLVPGTWQSLDSPSTRAPSTVLVRRHLVPVQNIFALKVLLKFLFTFLERAWELTGGNLTWSNCRNALFCTRLTSSPGQAAAWPCKKIHFANYQVYIAE